jgi:hypothetical protein
MLFNRPTTRADGGNTMKQFLSDVAAVLMGLVIVAVMFSLLLLPILTAVVLWNAAFN